MDDLELRFRQTFDHILQTQPDPPAYEELGDPLVRRGVPPGRGWRIATVSAVVVVVIGWALALTRPGFLAAGPTGEHLVVDYTQSVELTCEGMDDIEDDGGADDLTIEAWVDYDNQDARYEVRDNAGNRYIEVHRGGLGVFPTIEASRGMQLGRRSGCVRIIGPDGSSHFGATSPPFLPYPIDRFLRPGAELRTGLQDLVRYPTDLIPDGTVIEGRDRDRQGRSVTWYENESHDEGLDTPPHTIRREWAIDTHGRMTEWHSYQEIEGWFVVESETVLVSVESGPLDPALFRTDEMDHVLDRREFADEGDSDPVVTTTSIVAERHPLLDDATRVPAEEIPEDLRIEEQPGDRFLVIDDGVYVRLRDLAPAVVFGACDAVENIDVPDGWETMCE